LYATSLQVKKYNLNFHYDFTDPNKGSIHTRKPSLPKDVPMAPPVGPKTPLYFQHEYNGPDSLKVL
jgi:hypothetical protein